MTNGQQMGCRDQARPTTTTDERLSRIHDLLADADACGINGDAVFRLFDTDTKLAFSYSNWQYIAKTE